MRGLHLAKKKRKGEPQLVVIVADTHINSTVGLAPPSTNLDDGGTYRASKPQLAVWSAWRTFWQIIRDKKESTGAQVTAIANGDLNDFNVHDGAELISRSRADVIKMTIDVLEPMLAVADRVFIVRGTEAHVGKKANLEEAVARDIGAVPFGKSRHSWYWLWAEFGGVTFDVAHHPQTTARRPWTKDAAAARHAAIIRNEYWERNRTPPDVALRAHAHYFADSGQKRVKPLFVYCPPWQLTTSYGHRLGSAGGVESVGGLWFLCQDGRYTWDVETWKPPEQKLWQITS